jgi:uncharacterized protein (TIGR03067 family)
MRRFTLVLACALVISFVPAIGFVSLSDTLAEEKKAERNELAALEGTWVIIGKEFMGKKATDEEVKELAGKTVIKGGKITEWNGEKGKEEIISESTFKLDPKAKPKAMDLKIISGPIKGETQLAIYDYELDGDTLKICYSFGKGEKRPTEFAGKFDGAALFLTYKRIKK